MITCRPTIVELISIDSDWASFAQMSQKLEEFVCITRKYYLSHKDLIYRSWIKWLCLRLKLVIKKYFFAVIYRSPNQNKDEFECFIEKLQSAIDLMKNERPHCVRVTGDLNCRSQHWWVGDIDSPRGTTLDELIESNNFCQLIDKPTNIETTGKSCADMIFTDQLLLFVDYGVYPSLDNCCHHQIVCGKLSLRVPSPPPYKRKVWEYRKSDTEKVRTCLSNID